MTLFGKRNMVRHMVPNRRSYRTADRLTEGNLADILRAEREAGQSYQAIATRLFAEHGIEVSLPTLASWCDELGIEKAKAAS